MALKLDSVGAEALRRTLSALKYTLTALNRTLAVLKLDTGGAEAL